MARRVIDAAAACPRCGAQASYMRHSGCLRLQCTYCGYRSECRRPEYAEENASTRWEFDLRATRNDLELQLQQIPRWRQRVESLHTAVPLGPGHDLRGEIDQIDMLLSGRGLG